MNSVPLYFLAKEQVSDVMYINRLSQMRLENMKAGRKGNLNVATEVSNNEIPCYGILSSHFVLLLHFLLVYQIFQVAPSLHMVEVRKAKGDTLEFHKVSFLLLLKKFVLSK